MIHLPPCGINTPGRKWFQQQLWGYKGHNKLLQHISNSYSAELLEMKSRIMLLWFKTVAPAFKHSATMELWYFSLSSKGRKPSPTCEAWANVPYLIGLLHSHTMWPFPVHAFPFTLSAVCCHNVFKIATRSVSRDRILEYFQYDWSVPVCAAILYQINLYYTAVIKYNSRV